MLRHTRLLLLALGFALALIPAHAATQTLTILGANGVAGTTEPNTDYSKDGGVTWHPAYLFTGHPWGYIGGTNAWLNQNPSPFVGLNDRVDFRIRFFMPATWTNAQMTYQVNADNEADILLNGTQLVHTVGGPISSGTLATQYLVPGINTVYVRLIDYGGWVGLNYRINLSIEADSPIQLLTPPPSITSALTATGKIGVGFSYTTTATNSPTSFAASGLPAGLSLNPATGVISGTPTVAGTFNVLLTASSNFGSGSNTLILTIQKGTGTVTLGNLTHTYDGTVKSATATTSPSGMQVDFTYTGASVPPVNAGSYTAFGVINNANYAGSASGTLTIAKAPVAITLGNLTQNHDGSPKPVTVTTSPTGVATTVTYNSSPTVPSAVGSYAVAAGSANPNYAGTASGTLVIRDVTPPVLSLPASQTLEATGPAGAVATFSASATDVVSGSCPVTLTLASGSTFAIGTTTVNASASDAAGNIANGSFTITVRDTTPPTLVVPTSEVVVEATSPGGAFATFTTSATDLVDGSRPVSLSQASGTTFPIGTTTVTATASDTRGNSVQKNFTVTVRDTTAPVINVPANQILEATSAAGAVATYAATATDAVGATIAYSTASGSTFPLGTTTVTVTATDAANNVSTGSFTVTVRDTTAPVITAPGNIVTEATSAAGAIANFTASATDLVDGAVSVSSSVASGSTFPVGTTAVTLTATDAAGNVATEVFTVTVTDTTAPVIAPQDNLIVEATSADGAAVTFTPSALDVVNGAISVTSAPVSGSTFPLGVTTVTLTAHDAAGNATSATFTVTVVDTTAPVIATPAPITAEATSAAGAVVSFSPTASDLVDGAVSVTASPASGSTFPLGTTTVTLTSVDAAGNASSSSFAVTVRDTTAPVIAPLADQTLEAAGPLGAVATYAATASDAVGATVSYAPAPGSVFPLGTTTVTVTATDAAANSTQATFNVTVRDTTRPVLTLPASQTLEATGPTGAVATYSASALDLVSGALPVAFSTASGSTFALGATTVAASATDAAGNTAAGAFSITVRDSTAPVLTVPANLTLEATGPSGAVATYSATASDLVDGAVAVVASQSSGSTFPLGTTTVNLTATDAAGNATSGAFTVTVRDTTPPVLTTPGDLVVNSTSALGQTVTFAVTAADLVSGVRPVTVSPASGTFFGLGVTTVTASATDAAGNTVTRTFTVTLRAPAAALVNELSANNGTINGSLQQNKAAGTNFNGGGVLTGEFLVAGTPTIRKNGNPNFGGTVDGAGSTSPSGYTITLNGGASVGRIVRRMNPAALPSVAAPANPTGTRGVNLNRSSDPIGAWSTLKDLTLNGNVGNVTVPAGTYGSFTANGGSGFILGVAGATTPTVYQFQSLTLNGNSSFQIVGPVVIIVKNGFNANSAMGNSAHPEWLDLRIASGSLTLNGNVAFAGYVTAPTGTVIVNGAARLTGGLTADKLVVNGGGTVTLLQR